MDGLQLDDVESVVVTGRIEREFTNDPRGARYEVIGDTADGRRAGVVCRFLPSGILLIITAYTNDR